jgi:pimeloyl-ACP methyl ester carboxylesterase
MTPLLLLGLLPLTLAVLGWALWTPDLKRTELLARYAGAHDAVVELAGIRLWVRDQGDPSAPPVVMLHGVGASLQTWESWGEALASAHRVLCFDLPGFGLTGPDPTGSYSDEHSLAVLAALLHHFGLERVDLIGHSLGGRYAWEFAAKFPQSVRRLVLVAPDGFAGNAPAFVLNAGPPAWAPLLRYVMPKILVWLDLGIAYGDPRRLRGAIVARYYDMLRAPGVRASLLARWSQIHTSDPRSTLATISAPTLIVWGTRDRIARPSEAQQFASSIPNSHIEWLAGAGHLPQEEVPLQSVASVAKFLRT